MLTIKTTGLEDYLDPEGGGAWVQAIIIGDHGVGKTPFAGKWPRPIFAMCEHGTMSIAKDKLPYAEVYTDADMDAFVNEIRRDCAIKDMAKRKYLTVVVDTIDAYQKRLMDHRVASQQLDRFTGWDHWDWLDAKVSKVLRALSNLPVHLVVNMHFKNVTVGEGDDKTLVKEAKLKGDLKTAVYQEFDLIGFMETYYVTEAGQRERKHRIRWWPEPGFEMVRCRAVGDDGVLLPQFTPVDFKPSDFQTIFDHIVAGVDGLEESQVVAEVATATDVDAAAIPTPDQGAGPVAEPKLPPAKKAAKKTTKKAAAKDPEPAPEASAENGKGTAEVPLILDEDALNRLDGAKYAALAHIHSPEGRCLKTDFVRPCPLASPETGEAELPVEDPPEVPAAEPAEPAEPPAAPTPTTPPAAVPSSGGPLCGQQPESLAGKYATDQTGCGKPLTADNKAPLAVVKYKTQLCTACFATASQAS